MKRKFAVCLEGFEETLITMLRKWKQNSMSFEIYGNLSLKVESNRTIYTYSLALAQLNFILVAMSVGGVAPRIDWDCGNHRLRFDIISAKDCL